MYIKRSPKVHRSLRSQRDQAPKDWWSLRRALGVSLTLMSFAFVLVAEPVGTAFAQTDPTSSSLPTDGSSTTAPTTTAPITTVATTTVLSSSSSSTSSTTAAPTTKPVSTTIAPTTTVSPTTVQPASVPPTTVSNQIVIPPGKVLKVGSKGPDVLAMEKRFEELKIDTGKVDGRFDWSTWQGVVAFQKYSGLKRTGKVDNALRLLIQNSAALTSTVSFGPANRLEVDKGRQLLFMYKDNKLWRVIAISSGSGKKYCAISKKSGKKVCGTAITPTGRFKIQRRIPGWRESDLGRLYNPLYFNGGIAFHGAPSVPAYAASHGCVRLPMPVAEWFPKEVSNGTAVYVHE